MYIHIYIYIYIYIYKFIYVNIFTYSHIITYIDIYMYILIRYIFFCRPSELTVLFEEEKISLYGGIQFNMQLYMYINLTPIQIYRTFIHMN
jgi:hypothetical protein